jgi:UDP-N-acetyl-D-glucosamine/UDP-N-acetyl-D-galactosamine dehydrogenase
LKNRKICIIGLGYVGLPLAVAFAEKYEVIGFDISKSRISELKNFHDNTNELSSKDLKKAIDCGLKFSSNKIDIKESNTYIITVPTPLTINKNPDFQPLISASNLVGSVLKNQDLVIYESTVYPGATEEICVPVLEKTSKLTYINNTQKENGLGFYCGYSPERINPGDKKYTLKKIIKVTSGSTDKIAEEVDILYSSIVTAGTYKVSSIKVAEASKVIENTQRDLNIAFVNELAIIFNFLEINTEEVLKAAGTKWNFLPFKPGLVGGHCIGIDPYYLTYKAQQIGYKPEVILAGRKTNDYMPLFVANLLIKEMVARDFKIKNSRVLIYGVTFKENCPDIRNSKVFDLIIELKQFGCLVDVYDPLISPEDFSSDMISKEDIILDNYQSIILAVAHNEFHELNVKTEKNIVFDLKSILKNKDLSL